MRNESLFLLAGVAVAAYFIFFKKTTSYGGATGSWSPSPNGPVLPALAASPVPCPGTDAYLTRTASIVEFKRENERYDR